VFIQWHFSADLSERFTGNFPCPWYHQCCFRLSRDVIDTRFCATLLKPIPKGHKHEKRGFFGWFNRTFCKNHDALSIIVGRILRHSWICIIVFVVIIFLVGLFLLLGCLHPFCPPRIKVISSRTSNCPSARRQERTDEVLRQVEEYFLQQPEIESFITVAGFSFNGRDKTQRSLSEVQRLEQTKGAAHSVEGVIARARENFPPSRMPSSFPLNPPAIAELGNSTGFDFAIGGSWRLGHARLLAARNHCWKWRRKNPLVVGVRVQGLDDAAQLKIDVDEGKASALVLRWPTSTSTLQTSLGSSYVNNFINGNRVQRVIVQARRAVSHVTR